LVYCIACKFTLRFVLRMRYAKHTDLIVDKAHNKEL